jgi:hypothetical protein
MRVKRPNGWQELMELLLAPNSMKDKLRVGTSPALELLQLRVLHLGLLKDRNVRVGVFPCGKKILVG